MSRYVAWTLADLSRWGRAQRGRRTRPTPTARSGPERTVMPEQSEIDDDGTVALGALLAVYRELAEHAGDLDRFELLWNSLLVGQYDGAAWSDAITDWRRTGDAPLMERVRAAEDCAPWLCADEPLSRDVRVRIASSYHAARRTKKGRRTK